MTDARSALHDGSARKPVKLALSESSGPVSPLYQYEIQVTLTGDAKGLQLEHKQSGGASSGIPELSLSQPVPEDVYLAFMTELLDAGVLSLKDEVLSEQARQKDGGGPCSFALDLGDQKVRFGYTPNHLKRDDHPAHKRVLALTRAFHTRLARG